MSLSWKKGRGKLGVLQPLLGTWLAEADSEIGPVRCTRIFEEVLNGAYIQLKARWEFRAIPEKASKDCPDVESLAKKAYEEIALIGPGDDGKLHFWSFQSDGKRSQGVIADVTEIHKFAIGFEAQMPGGLARMAYWPDDSDGFRWAVESKNKKGWRRFVEHHYRSA
ncbi:MAG: hypothetical protein IT367_17780 [Candidatus Hydrogenedentes bacterium]|nr:hypothetical protein [Candidatus Hydrogenedentota bacterium]